MPICPHRGRPHVSNTSLTIGVTACCTPEDQREPGDQANDDPAVGIVQTMIRRAESWYSTLFGGQENS